MLKLRGFTLVELMIALTILGVLTALVLPMLNGNSPNRNKMMMKKAYFTIEDVTRDLINDEVNYPQLGSDGNTYTGFDNTLSTCGASCSGLAKFGKLFARQLNVDGNVTDITDGVLFNTSDGITWQIVGKNTAPTAVTATGENGIVQEILVDVNGSKKPNTYQGEISYATSRLRDYDQFKVFVTKSGKVIPASGQSWFENAISIDSSLNGD